MVGSVVRTPSSSARCPCLVPHRGIKIPQSTQHGWIISVCYVTSLSFSFLMCLKVKVVA